MTIRTVCVFCGARAGSKPMYLEQARAFGEGLAARGLDLVYGGAAHGLMGAVADGALSGGAKIIGVIPHGLARQEFAHPKLTESHFVDSMHERKALMTSRADAFVALPGGFGTMDELFEALTWHQVGLHTKPIGLLNTEGFYSPLLSWVQRGLDEGFIAPQLNRALVVHETPGALLDALLTHQVPPPAVQWRATRLQ